MRGHIREATDRAPGLATIFLLAFLVLVTALLTASALRAQEVTVRDLTQLESDVPLRLMGYGLVVGLNGSGDRALGTSHGGTFTVQSVANLLRRFEIEVPEEVLRTRNVAAVLVTAEASPWLRPGGRFTVQVSSLGDATSLDGGVLWMTPLVADVGEPALAAAQGPLVLAGAEDRRYAGRYQGRTSAQIPDGGVMERLASRNGTSDVTRLLLKEPDLGAAEQIAEALNGAFGEGAAEVEDPGSVRVRTGGDAPSLTALQGVAVTVARRPTILVDSRDGTVVAGGGIRVGEAVVSHGGMTLAIQGTAVEEEDAGQPAAPGELRLPGGVSVQDVAAALHAVGASAREISAILRGLRDVGALQAEVVVR